MSMTSCKGNLCIYRGLTVFISGNVLEIPQIKPKDLSGKRVLEEVSSGIAIEYDLQTLGFLGWRMI